MAFLYFKNTTTTGVWNDVTNWFEDDACTIAAANVPWVAGDSTYLGYDLTRSSDSITAEDQISIDAEIGNGLAITGICDIASIGTVGIFENTNNIYGGTFSGNNFLNNYGSIIGGEFSGDNLSNSGGSLSGGMFSGDNLSNSGTISGGTFSGSGLTNNVSSDISGGIFTGSGLVNNYNISGGSFIGSDLTNNASIYGGTFAGDDFTNGSGGYIYGGTFSNTSGFANDGYVDSSVAKWATSYQYLGVLYTPFTPPSEFTIVIPFVSLDFLYFKNTTSTGVWNDVTNWFTDPACTTQALNAPWVSGDTTYTSYNLTRSVYSSLAADPVYIDSDIFMEAIGTCDIGSISSNTLNNSAAVTIYGGVFSGAYFTNAGSINNGTFTGGNFINNDSIYGGVFTGGYFTNNSSVNGGTFSGSNFTNSGNINAGKFSGTFDNIGSVYGGLFDTSIGLTMPIGNGGVLYDFSLFPDTLFIGGTSWSTSSNWFEDYECTIPWAGTIPWTDASTEGKNILRGRLGEGFSIASNIQIDVGIGNGLNITGTCYITYSYNHSLTWYSYIANASYNTIYGGTFTGQYFLNGYYAYIYGGNFAGDYFQNSSYGYIYGGTFTGVSFYNGYYSYIYGGTFTGQYFLSDYYSYISGGTFSGADMTITNYSVVYGGLFNSDNINLSNNSNIYGGLFIGNYMTVNGYCNIHGGVFTGNGFTLQGSGNSNVYGGVFSGDGFFSDYSNFVHSGIFCRNNYSISSGAYSWFFLEKGSLDATAFYDPILYTPVFHRVSGNNSGTPSGIAILRIEGQDVLGGGLL